MPVAGHGTIMREIGTYTAPCGHDGLVMEHRETGERLRRRMQVAANIIVNSLVDHDFSGVEQMTHGRYVTAADLEHAVTEMGGTLIRAPIRCYDELTFSRLPDSEPPTFETRIPLWTAEHGRTKTTLVIRFHEREDIPDVVQPLVVSVTSSIG